jgi:hypothetical protein
VLAEPMVSLILFERCAIMNTSLDNARMHET